MSAQIKYVNGVLTRRRSSGQDEWIIEENTYCPVCNECIHPRGTTVYNLKSVPFYKDYSWWLNAGNNNLICAHPKCLEIILLNPLAYGI